MRRVVDLIRGQHVEEARRILRFSPLGATRVRKRTSHVTLVVETMGDED